MNLDECWHELSIIKNMNKLELKRKQLNYITNIIYGTIYIDGEPTNPNIIYYKYLFEKINKLLNNEGDCI